MNIHITLDYELFFGNKTGSVDKCMLEPTIRLLSILDPHSIKATFYIDVGYIERANSLGEDLENVTKVVGQLKKLNLEGHDLQLHVHPHWEDATFENGRWQFDMRRYRLAMFTQAQALDLINRYVAIFEFLDLPKPCSFRAGGWCIQPFEHIADALFENGIRLDSTVYNRGENRSTEQYFDFTNAPDLNNWRFQSDPCIPTKDGRFHELPISSLSISPLFYWRFAFAKKLGGHIHKSFGDGNPIKLSKFKTLRLLSSFSYTVASIDGYKASLLAKVAQRYEKKGDLVLIGHPKAFSTFSITELDKFVSNNKNVNYLTARQWLLNKDAGTDG